jgi:hypothetical protein
MMEKLPTAEWIKKALRGGDPMEAFAEGESASTERGGPYNYPTACSLGLTEAEWKAVYDHDDNDERVDKEHAGVFAILAVRYARERGFKGHLVEVFNKVQGGLIGVMCEFPATPGQSMRRVMLMAAVRWIGDSFEARLFSGSLQDAIFSTRLDEDGMCRFSGGFEETGETRAEAKRRRERDAFIDDMLAALEKYKAART